MRKINILLILVILGVGAFGYFRVKNYSSPPLQSPPELTFEESVANEVEEAEVSNEAISVFDDQPMIELSDVSGGNATGMAWIVVEDGKTFHRVVAYDLPELTNGDFYEGWLVRPAPDFDFFSTGAMIFDDAENAWVLDYETEGDRSDYSNVVITLEPDDGDPAPAEHILE